MTNPTRLLKLSEASIFAWLEQSVTHAIPLEMNAAGGHPKTNSRKRTGCAAGWLHFTTDFIQYVIQMIQVTVAVVDGATVAEVQNHVIVLTASTTPKILNEY